MEGNYEYFDTKCSCIDIPPHGGIRWIRCMEANQQF